MRLTSRFRRRATRGIADTSGASAVEFALVAPVFLFLIFATLEVGFVMYLRSAVEAATQNAARMAITGDTYGSKGDREALIKQYLENKLSNILFSSTKYTIQTEVYDSIANLGGAGLPQAGMSAYGGRNNIVKYTVAVDYDFIIPAIDFIPGAGESLKIMSTVFVKNEAF